ncbi:hypothetical protein UA08_04731 [Talaromyces atroroseus]|uniref:BZIP domain-containing protein n=1 Tax=Talaromyces atroroseus TaxID=1441469 RepID=A0A225B2H7_TALAT|nr:hypothetical protein UA08_04731 [Talaromyces atroroseus]OKL60057.1 hypothetical protein UA08_04731 [Talaromyces atroroseus]
MVTTETLRLRGLPPADDWYGVSDARERRKRQNRVNQRAHRSRTRPKQDLTNPSQVRDLKPSLIDHEPIHRVQNDPSEQVERRELSQVSLQPVSCLSGASSPNTSTNVVLSRFLTSQVARVSALWLKIPGSDKREILLEQVARFYQSYRLNCPTADHLLTLTKVNVHRGFVSNMEALGITWEWMEDDSISPFCMAGPACDTEGLPEKLRPTEVQRRNVHHTWIDLFPCPRMRDNLIRIGNDWDDEDLCIDIMGFWDGASAGPFGLIIWGEATDIRNWEVTEGFVKKWGWVIQGCIDLMWSTNSWRAKRGIGPLFPMS